MAEQKTRVVRPNESYEKGFPDEIYLRLRDLGGLESMAGTIGSGTPAELVDVALSALEWIVENRKAGRRIYATDADLSGALPVEAGVSELLVDLRDNDNAGE